MNNTFRTSIIIAVLLITLIVLLYGLGDALGPLMISFGLSYLTFPLIKKLESKNIDRKYSVPFIFISITFLFLMVMALVLPNLIRDGYTFLKELPQNANIALEKLEVLSESYGYTLDLSKESIKSFIKDHISGISAGMLKSITLSLKTSFGGITKWLIAILNLFLIPLFFFYLINDYEKLTKEIKSFIPKSFRPKLSHYFERSNDVLSGYIRGQLMVALCLALLYAIGLSLIGLKFGILIGLISGLISIIPYAGFTLGFTTALIMGFAHYSGPGTILGVIAVYIIVQMLEGIVITPKLVGDKVGLSALATMLVLIIGGNLFGLIGMLIAIPIAAILKSILFEIKAEYQDLDFYKS